ncbi:MAG: heavy-metal-associated domain-containing protein, partial [Chloroflexota bacterium]|nr:heavy-metal-associated domain-containing protein [Chloroflexota bacterium]
MKTITLPVYGLNDATCGQIIERRLGALAGVERADASYVTQTVTIAYDESQISEAKLREWVADCGFACGEPMQAEHMLHASARQQRAATHTPGVHDAPTATAPPPPPHPPP